MPVRIDAMTDRTQGSKTPVKFCKFDALSPNTVSMKKKRKTKAKTSRKNPKPD
jgi:hypothetical protein